MLLACGVLTLANMQIGLARAMMHRRLRFHAGGHSEDIRRRANCIYCCTDGTLTSSRCRATETQRIVTHDVAFIKDFHVVVARAIGCIRARTDGHQSANTDDPMVEFRLMTRGV